MSILTARWLAIFSWTWAKNCENSMHEPWWMQMLCFRFSTLCLTVPYLDALTTNTCIRLSNDISSNLRKTNSLCTTPPTSFAIWLMVFSSIREKICMIDRFVRETNSISLANLSSATYLPRILLIRELVLIFFDFASCSIIVKISL